MEGSGSMKTCGPGQEGHPLVSTLWGGQRGVRGCHGVCPDKQEHGLELLILRMSVVAPRHHFALLQGTEDAAGSRDRSRLQGDVPRGALGMDMTRTAVATRDAVSRLVWWPAGQTSSSQGECDCVRPPQSYQEGPALCLGRSTAVQCHARRQQGMKKPQHLYPSASLPPFPFVLGSV